MNADPKVTHEARCITARQDSGISNRKGEHSGVIITGARGGCMKRLLKPFKTNKAEGYIDTVVCVMAAMMVIVLALNVFSFLTLKQDMDHFAKELIDTATTYGRTNEQATNRYNELCDELGISPSVGYSGTTYLPVIGI